MFAAALIVFRESLEAALIISIMASATRGIPSRARWMLAGILAGLAGAALVASSMGLISSMASGMGQELFNAGILMLAVGMLAWHNIWMSVHGREMAAQAASTARAIHDGTRTTLGGGASGLAAGLLVGGLLYGGLLRVPLRWFFSITGILVLLLAASMASQAARFLIQADLLPSLGAPLWDSSGLLSQTSALGTLLHAMIGYDAQPAGMQIVFYVVVLVAISAGMRWVAPRKRHGPTQAVSAPCAETGRQGHAEAASSTAASGLVR